MKQNLLLGLLGVLICGMLQAQQKQVTGIVKNRETKGVIDNVSVVIKGTKRGTITDANGKFFITASVGETFVFSLIGFQPEQFKVKSLTEVIDITLAPAANSSGDVIIIGGQTQAKRTTAAAVSSVSGKDIENLPAPSVDQLLQGRVPGLNVQITSGEPGVAPSMVVRGNSRVGQNVGSLDQAHALSGPLYVIDGIPVNPEDISNIDATGTNYLAGISVNDIETIDVQKDAIATAAWGSRGANGVVYIKTRRGRSKKPEFHVNIFGGAVVKPNLLPTVTGQEERRQKLGLLNEYGTYAQLGTIPQMLTDSLNPAYNNATDWQGLFYRNASIKNVDLSMSAATDNINYRLSMNYYDEQGVIKAFGFQRYSLRGNFDFRISPKLTAQFIVGLSKTDRQRGRKYSNTDDNTPFSGAGIPASFLRLTAFDSLNYNGLYDKLRNQNINDLYSGSLTLNYNIVKNLRFVVQASANTTNSSKDFFQPSNIDQVAALNDPSTVQSSYAESDANSFTNYFLSNSLTYAKTFSGKNGHDQHLTVTASQQFKRDVYKKTVVSGYNVPSNDIQVVSGIPQANLSGYSDYSASSMLSYLGQAQYDYDGKYLFYVSARTDASSRFGDNTKWGSFPAIGGGWIASDEKFMGNTKNWLSFLKVRGSYGVSGAEPQNFYAPYNSYQVSGTYNGASAIQPTYTNGLTKNDLTWSKTTQKNVGIEARFLHDRISLVTDVYDKLTKDDYFDFNLPFYTGFSSINFNAKDLWVSNRGIEVQIITHNLPRTSKLQWNTNLNFAFNKNIIAKLPNNNRTFVQDDYYGISRVYSVGQPIYEMFQMRYKGVYNKESDIPFNPITGNKITYFKGNYPVKPGYPIWEDVNKDFDVWSDENNGDQYGDRVPTGNPNPKITGGFINDFSFGNFSLTVISTFTWKRDVINTLYQQQLSNVFNFGGIYSFAANRLPSLAGLNYWTPTKAAKDPNYQASFPALNPYGANFYQFLPFSTMFNEDGSYFKIKSLVGGYRLPQRFTDKLKISGARVYGIMDNVLIIKNSTLPDPEAVNELGVYTGGLYPIPRKFTLGIDITF